MKQYTKSSNKSNKWEFSYEKTLNVKFNKSLGLSVVNRRVDKSDLTFKQPCLDRDYLSDLNEINDVDRTETKKFSE